MIAQQIRPEKLQNAVNCPVHNIPESLCFRYAATRGQAEFFGLLNAQQSAKLGSAIPERRHFPAEKVAA